MTKIDIISGFLGAGKTTFIKKLLEEAIAGEQVVLIENEFGEVGIDGGFLKDSGIEIREMNSGCICCSLVGDFGKSLAEVLTRYEPQRVIIEPSGVGKLSDVMKAVREVSGDMDVTLNSAVTMVDATKCKMYMKNFGEFFNNQIENAGAIVLSRTDVADSGKVQLAVDMIRRHNDKAAIITTPCSSLSGPQLLEIIEKPEDVMIEELLKEVEEEHRHHHRGKACGCGHGEHGHHHHGEACGCQEEGRRHHGEACGCQEEGRRHGEACGRQEEGRHHGEACGCQEEGRRHHGEACGCQEEGRPHDEVCGCGEEGHHHHDKACGCQEEGRHHHGESCGCGEHHHQRGEACGCGEDHHHADEVFSSWGMDTVIPCSREKLDAILDELAYGDEYGEVLRAKGMIPGEKDREWYYFDLVPEEYEIREGKPDYTGKVCVIGAKLNEEALECAFGRS